VVECRESRRGGANIIPDNPNWRRFRYACAYYRERWAAEDEAGVDGRPLLYQIICLQNTPPENADEQNLCLSPRKVCWRLRPATNGKKSRARPAQEPVGEPTA